MYIQACECMRMPAVTGMFLSASSFTVNVIMFDWFSSYFSHACVGLSNLSATWDTRFMNWLFSDLCKRSAAVKSNRVNVLHHL